LIRRLFHEPVPGITNDRAFHIRCDKPALLNEEIAGSFFAGQNKHGHDQGGLCETGEVFRVPLKHAKVLATYGTYLLSARPESYLYRAGQMPRLIVTTKDYDNKPVQTTVHLSVKRPDWLVRLQHGEAEDFGSRDITTGPDGTATLEWPLNKSGSFEVIASSQSVGRELRDI
jgi:hypothetical protein